MLATVLFGLLLLLLLMLLSLALLLFFLSLSLLLIGLPLWLLLPFSVPSLLALLSGLVLQPLSVPKRSASVHYRDYRGWRWLFGVLVRVCAPVFV